MSIIGSILSQADARPHYAHHDSLPHHHPTHKEVNTRQAQTLKEKSQLIADSKSLCLLSAAW